MLSSLRDCYNCAKTINISKLPPSLLSLSHSSSFLSSPSLSTPSSPRSSLHPLPLGRLVLNLGLRTGTQSHKLKLQKSNNEYGVALCIVVVVITDTHLLFPFLSFFFSVYPFDDERETRDNLRK